MEALLRSSSAALLTPKAWKLDTGTGKRKPFLVLANGYSSSSSSSWPLTTQKHSVGHRKSVVIGAKKNNKKEDTHSFVAKPDEATGPFPEAVLLKEKKVQEDGRVLPEFADAEEEKVYESLKLQLQSDLKVERMRHYEVVYLIHEKHAEEVGSVNEKVQDFLREKRGKIWRVSDWGMRRLAYKIQKAKNAHYMLMNFEIEAQWINDFKNMLDRDERVIRHLVIKREEAITEDCPPPPEFHTLRSGMDDDDDDDEEEDDYDDEYYTEDWDENDDYEMDGFADGTEDDIVIVNSEEDDDRNDNTTKLSKTGERKLKVEKVRR